MRISASFFFVMLSCSIRAQVTAPQIPTTNIPTSPEAAVIQRFGDIPVSYYTGMSTVAIPLYTVKEGSVEVPIVLQYQSSGVKVDEQATWVGLSWNLAPEGTIIQEVRGMPDELDLPISCDGNADYATFLQRFQYVQDNTLQFHNQVGRELAPNTCIDDGYGDPYCFLQKALEGHGQPDIYSYSFSGQSGKFYINPTTHEIVVINKTELALL